MILEKLALAYAAFFCYEAKSCVRRRQYPSSSRKEQSDEVHLLLCLRPHIDFVLHPQPTTLRSLINLIQSYFFFLEAQNHTLQQPRFSRLHNVHNTSFISP